MAEGLGTPWAAGAQALLGLGQTLFSGQRKAQKNLEQHLNSYKPNQGIMDFYTKALSKYNANPYTSASYNRQTQNANRNLTTGLSSLQDRRSGLAGVGSLVQGANDASLKAVGQAEQDQSQDLAQLGQATGMKAQEDKYKFEGKYNLLSQKAGAASQTTNAGISNLFGGLGGIQDYANINKFGGDGSGDMGGRVGTRRQRNWWGQ